MEKKTKKLTKKQVAEIDRFLLGWYALGWNANPNTLTVRDAVRCIITLACAAHVNWLHAMKTDRAPGEDVSPAEGLLPLAYLLEHCASKAKVRSVSCGLLQREFAKKHRKFTDQITKKISEQVHLIAPGHLWGEKDEH